jgi:Transposase
MTKDDVLFGYRQALFAEAARTSVAEACRRFGVHRSTYYGWKQAVERHGGGTTPQGAASAQDAQPAAKDGGLPLPAKAGTVSQRESLRFGPGPHSGDRNAVVVGDRLYRNDLADQLSASHLCRCHTGVLPPLGELRQNLDPIRPR